MVHPLLLLAQTSWVGGGVSGEEVGRMGLGRDPPTIACTHSPGHLFLPKWKGMQSPEWLLVPGGCSSNVGPCPMSPTVVPPVLLLRGLESEGTQRSTPPSPGFQVETMDGGRRASVPIPGADPGQGARGAEGWMGAIRLRLITAYLPQNSKRWQPDGSGQLVPTSGPKGPWLTMTQLCWN